MTSEIKDILRYSKNAPSGDNSQPWRFSIDGNKVIISFLPEADNPILNFRLRGTLIALGALIENIILSSPMFGSDAQFQMNLNYATSNTIGIVKFQNNNAAVNALALAIPKRQTNRTKYSKKKLTSEEINSFSTLAVGTASIKTITNKSNIDKLSKILSTAEYVVLRNRLLHSLLFKDLVWTKEEEIKKKRGLFVDTLELDPPAKFVMNIAKSWKIMKVLKTVGLPKLVASQNQKSYSSSGAFCAIVIPKSDNAFIDAGRTLERIWLYSTKESLGLQPLNGLLFLGMGTSNDPDVLSFSDRVLVTEQVKLLNKIFSVEDDHLIATIVRVGHMLKRPSGSSSKAELGDLILD